jgi:hypothetical protein
LKFIVGHNSEHFAASSMKPSSFHNRWSSVKFVSVILITFPSNTERNCRKMERETANWTRYGGTKSVGLLWNKLHLVIPWRAGILNVSAEWRKMRSQKWKVITSPTREFLAECGTDCPPEAADFGSSSRKTRLSDPASSQKHSIDNDQLHQGGVSHD